MTASGTRRAQEEYSEIQPLMRDEGHRRRKAHKILDVVLHFLGRTDLDGLRVLDVGASSGFIADECAAVGGTVIGADIDRPGLRRASERFAHHVSFVAADGSCLPMPDRSIDLVVLNHIYEHVVDARAVMREIRRVLRDGGIVYLGLGNRLGVMEPHYRLPFLSWLPPSAADAYVRSTGRAEAYHERLLTRPALRRLAGDFTIWDYTVTVLAEPGSFDADDLVPERLASVPPGVWRASLVLLPAYLWVGVKGDREPAGATTVSPPRRL
jgi:ubiquinone/menaquinone biosynthesis C-methylase UbiE